WKGQESGLGEYAWWGVGLFLAIDIVGQSLRFFIQRKAANLFGKAKTFLVVVLLVAAALELMYGTPAAPLPHARMIPMLMWFCTAMAFFSVAFKIIPNYWYANILSILNLVCGLAGIVVILMGKPTIYAFGLVFLGQFLDLFDGRAAERWGSTPRGEIFDDVADGTSFGGTVGLIVYTSFKDWRVGAALGVVHVIATVYRLIRFVVEKRKAGEAGGVAWFSGLPSPGGALMTGTACLFLASEPLRAVFTIAGSLLMVSRVPYPHFGRAILPLIPKFFRVLILAGYTLVLVHAVRHDYYDWALASLFAVSFVYLVSPLFGRRPAPKGA
ncbi:MAG TPA: CDP-alcohol phosphatidyltransferase family protein, partial [Geobacteraceae bacterium]